MRVHTNEHIVSIGVILSILFLSQVSCTAAASSFHSTIEAALQTTTESFEVLPDPYLQTEVELYTHGTSNEFNATHVDTGGISSYVNLTWTHTSGTELQLTRLPGIWEFCYFTTSFQWVLDRIPTDAMFYISYGVSTTGDFNTTEGETMFNVHAWLIDSSDEWQSIHESEPPYTPTVHQYSYDLNYFDLSAGWRGMVEDDSGYQEDPEDILRVGVGLAPSEAFETYNNGYPWQEYNGSVSAIVQTLSLVVYLEPETPTLIIEPYYVVAPIGIIVAVVVVYFIWRRYERT